MLKFLKALTIVLLFSLKAAAATPGEVINNLIRLPIPTGLTLCGEPVPLHHEDVLERLEYEMIVILGNAVQTSLWFKRSGRFFPEIEAELKELGLPDDLKYVSVIESSLRADAVSSAGAMGPWQFMAPTARDYGLRADPGVDPRRDWTRSTKSAARLLKELRKQMGSWPLALASYNAGPGRVRSAMEWQNADNFFDLKLPDETERYVFRFLATKIIMGSPELYGLDTVGANIYGKLPVTPVYLDIRKNRVSLLSLSRAAGVSHRYFLELNPHLTAGELGRGSYLVYVPDAGLSAFTRYAETLKVSTPPVQTASKAKAEKPPKEQIPVFASDPAGPPVFENPPGAPKTEAVTSKPAEEGAAVSAEASADTGAKAGQGDSQATEAVPASAPAASETEPPVLPGQPNPGDRMLNYIVKRGDTLSGIAKQFAVKVDSLMNENGLNPGSILRPGNKLVVPRRESP